MSADVSPIRYVVAGEYFASRGPTELRTVLGSCVSACLFDAVTGVGGMNHFLLPGADGDPPTARYGADAMSLLIEAMEREGADPRRLVAKVFGGCATLSLGNGGDTVGDRNAAFVRQYLEDRRIPIVAECLDRDRAVRLRFFTATGSALVQRMPAKAFAAEANLRLSSASIVQRKAAPCPPTKIERSNCEMIATTSLAERAATQRSIIAIGASTGGTDALKRVLSALPADSPPIVAVQHMPPGYTKSFAETLDRVCNIHVREAVDGDVIKPGTALLAPGGLHMEVKRLGGVNIVKLRPGPRVNRFRPSVDVLFFSCAREFRSRTVGVLLTGMGNDGAQGMLTLRNLGCYTIAQDEATSVVFGMPKHAIDLGAAVCVLPLHRIPQRMLEASASDLSQHSQRTSSRG
ncbi:MAG TPA: chemotaxis protein CheB [Pirellulaceae bacterium]|nr:chemotaxis protein CheB [Pirellulaceae bacterium]